MLVLANISTPSSKLTVQVYLPESADSTELRVLDDVYSVKDFISDVNVVDDPIAALFGPFHTVFTDNGTLTDEPNSTVQVKVGEDPDRMGLGESEWRLKVGSGTIRYRYM